MFEGKPPKAPLAPDFGPAGGDAGMLREMTWSDLRARLDAARDLREALHQVEEEHLASFDASSARHIAALAQGKHSVNPDDLANGKGHGCMDAARSVTETGSHPRK